MSDRSDPQANDGRECRSSNQVGPDYMSVAHRFRFTSKDGFFGNENLVGDWNRNVGEHRRVGDPVSVADANPYLRTSTPVCVLYWAASPHAKLVPLWLREKKSKSPYFRSPAAFSFVQPLAP